VHGVIQIWGKLRRRLGECRYRKKRNNKHEGSKNREYERSVSAERPHRFAPKINGVETSS
jgi:hypothetical protein